MASAKDPQSLSDKPQRVAALPSAYIRIHVCQASYGDSLAIELDPTPPVDDKNYFADLRNKLASPSRSVILIDGGPAAIVPSGLIGQTAPVIVHMYNMLNDLLPAGGHRLDTLVVTHDDADHIRGICQLIRRALKEVKPLQSDKPQNVWWNLGAECRVANPVQSPVANIWHNSAESILKWAKFTYKGRGYFDQGLEDWKKKMGDRTPVFNGEFPKRHNNSTPLIVWDANQNERTPATYRGQVEFNFCGPAEKQNQDLAAVYKESGPTAGVKGITSNKAKESKDAPAAAGLYTNLTSNPKNDASKKNLSSIVFTMAGQTDDMRGSMKNVSALFMGDASAATTFGSGVWDGSILHYDVLKVPHHGSCYNNHFGADAIGKIKSFQGDQGFYPGSAAWKANLLPRLADGCKETKALEGVLTFLGNIRAQDYIISGAHDVHENPHITTLVGIIARSIMFPAPNRPVRIYLTNPIRKKTWRVLVDFWLGVSHLDFTPVPDKKPMNYFEQQLEEMRKGARVDAAKPIIKDLLYDTESEHYEFLQLRPDRSHGRVDLGLPTFSWTDWTTVNPFDSWNDLTAMNSQFYKGDYMANISEDMVNLGLEKTGRKAAKGEQYKLKEKFVDRYKLKVEDTWSNYVDQRRKEELWSSYDNLEKKQKLDDNRIPTQQASPTHFSFMQRAPSPQFDYQVADEKPNVSFVSISQSDGLEAQELSPDLQAAESSTIQEIPPAESSVHEDPTANAVPIGSMVTQVQLTASSEIVPADAAPTEDAPAIGSPPLSDATAINPSIFSAAENAASNPEPGAGSRETDLPAPVPLQPNWKAFRRFGVDMMDMPLGDTFGKDMKLKVLLGLYELMNHLLLEDAFTVEPEAKASPDGSLPPLGAMLNFLLGAEGTSDILKVLPINSSATGLPNELGPNIGVSMLPGGGISPLFWTVSRLKAIVRDAEAMGYAIQGSTGIREVSMRISSPAGDTTTWIVPNPAQLQGNGRMKINVHQGIDLTIYWPCNPRRRIVYGYFEGAVPVGSGRPEHKVVCDFLMLPNPDTSVQYHIQFADDNYNIANHTMPFTELLAVFDGAVMDLANTATKALFPGLDLDSLNNSLQLSEPGFVFARGTLFSPQLQLYRIFGTIESTNRNEWRPFKDLKTDHDVGAGMASFLESVSIAMPRVQLTVQDPFSKRGPKLFFHLYHAVTVAGVLLEYEIESLGGMTGGTAYQLTFIPSSTVTNQSLTITGLLQALTLSALDPADLPDALHSILDSVGIRSFRLGWNSGELHGRPDFIDICLQISNLNIADDTLAVEDVLLRIRIDWPGGATKAGTGKNVYMQAIGTIEVVNHDVAVLFTYGTPPHMLDDGYLASGGTLDLQLLDSPLSLGDVLSHFFPGQTAIPEPFNTVVNEVGLLRFRLQIAKTTKGKEVISLVEVGLGVKKQRIQLLDDLVLVFPQLSLTSSLPPDPDATKRDFAIDFEAMVEMSGRSVLINVSAITSVQAQFSIILSPGGDGFPVSAFVEFCTKHLNEELHLNLPEKFESLRQCYLNGFSLIVAKDPNHNNQWKLQNIGFAASSDLVLELWDQPKVALERIAVAATYQRPRGLNFVFNATLDIGSCTLDTVVQYGDASVLSGPTGVTPQPDTSVPPDGTPKGWLVQATYDGEISLHEIVQKLTGLDVKGNLESTNLEKLKTGNDLIISKPVLSIRKEGNGGSIAISFDSNWSVFKHFDFAATLENSSWGFCIAMVLQDDLLHLLPSGLQVLGDYLIVDNTNIAFYMGVVNAKKAGIAKDLPEKRVFKGSSFASSTTFTLAVKTHLTLGPAFGPINDWADHKSSIDVEGLISSEGFQLAVNIGNFFWPRDKPKDPTFALDASIFVGSNKQRGFHVGIAAHMKIHLPAITKSLIDIEDAYFMLDTSSKSLALGLTIDGPLEDLFSITGFTAKNLAFNMSFSQADPMIPTELAMAGDLSLASAAGAHGKIDFYFAPKDVSNCYFSGLLENIDIVVIINTLLQQHNLPAVAKEVLQGNLKINKLALEMAFREIHNEKRNLTIQPGFLFAADVQLDVSSWSWSGFIHIEFRTTGKFSFILLMSPVHFGIGSETFFSLTRADPPSGLQDPKLIRGPATAGQQDLPEPSNRFDGGPVIYIVPDDTQTPLFVSIHAKILGFEISTRLEGTKDSFKGQLTASVSELIKLDVHADLKLNDRAHINGLLSLNVDVVTIPNVVLNAVGIDAQIPGSTWTRVQASLEVDLLVSWPKDQTTRFTLVLKGRLAALDHAWDFPELNVSDVNISDFDEIGRITKRVADWVVEKAADIITDGLKALHIEDATRFLKEKIGMAEDEIVRAVQVITNDPDAQKALNTVKDALSLTGETVANLVKTIFSGDPPEEQLRKLLNVVPREALLSDDGAAEKIRGVFGPIADIVLGPTGRGPIPFPFPDGGAGGGPISLPFPGGVPVLPVPFDPMGGIIDAIGGVVSAEAHVQPTNRAMPTDILKQQLDTLQAQVESQRRAGGPVDSGLLQALEITERMLRDSEQHQQTAAIGGVVDPQVVQSRINELQQELNMIEAKAMEMKGAGRQVDPQLEQAFADRKRELNFYLTQQQAIMEGGDAMIDPRELQALADADQQAIEAIKKKVMEAQAAGGQLDPQVEQELVYRQRHLDQLLAQQRKMAVRDFASANTGGYAVALPAAPSEYVVAEQAVPLEAVSAQVVAADQLPTESAELSAYAVAQPAEEPVYAFSQATAPPAFAEQRSTALMAPMDERSSLPWLDLLSGSAVRTDLSSAEAAARTAAIVPPGEPLPPQGLTLVANLAPPTSAGIYSYSMEAAPEPVFPSQMVSETVALSQAPAESVVPVRTTDAELVPIEDARAPPMTAASQSPPEAGRNLRASLSEADSIGLLRDLKRGGWSVEQTWRAVTGLFTGTSATQLKGLMLTAGWTENDLLEVEIMGTEEDS